MIYGESGNMLVGSPAEPTAFDAKAEIQRKIVCFGGSE